MEELSAIAGHKPFRKIPKTASLLHRIRRGSAKFSNPKITLACKARPTSFRFAIAKFTGFVSRDSVIRNFPGALLEKILGMPVTVRNPRTIEKIAQGCCAASKRRD